MTLQVKYQPVNNRSDHQSENFRLLSISESSSEDKENSTIKTRQPKRSKSVEDLKLVIPSLNNSKKPDSQMNRIRRKIRLKRKQRDRLSSNGVPHQININNSSTSETAGSELENDENCLTCMQNKAFNCFCSRCSCRQRSRAHRHIWLNAFVLFIFAVALSGLAYYTMTLQNQLAILTIHLDPVLDDKSTLKKSQEELQNKLNTVAANQSILQDNLASIYTKVESLNSQVSKLNGSITNALANLANAPQLEDVPDKISKISEELGLFGSRLTGIENQVQETKDDLSKVHNKLNELPKISNNSGIATTGQVNKSELHALTVEFDSKLYNETAKLDEKIDEAAKNFNILGTNLTQQLQKQEIHAANSWKLLDKLNNDVQNVSAKAASNELVSRNNQAEIEKIRQSGTKSGTDNAGSMPPKVKNNLN